MAKFDEEEWKKRMARDMAQEEADQAAQAGRDRKMDDEFMGDAFYLLGVNPSDLAKFRKEADEAAQGLVNSEEAMRIIKKGQKAYNKGDREKARRILNSNQDVKKIAKAAKKGKGCAVVSLLMLMVGGSAAYGLIYGAVEVVSALSR